MNGKDIVVEAVGKVRDILGSIRSDGHLDGDAILEETEKAVALIDRLKNRPTLRTKNGTSLAIPVQEACTYLEEAWEDSEGTDDLDDVKEKLEEFAGVANTLNNRMKQKTVIMT